MLIKVMSDEDSLPDEDPQKLFELYSDVINVGFEVESGKTWVNMIFEDRDLNRTVVVEGNVYVMNGDGLLVSTFVPRPVGEPELSPTEKIAKGIKRRDEVAEIIRKFINPTLPLRPRIDASEEEDRPVAPTESDMSVLREALAEHRPDLKLSDAVIAARGESAFTAAEQRANPHVVAREHAACVPTISEQSAGLSFAVAHFENRAAVAELAETNGQLYGLLLRNLRAAQQTIHKLESNLEGDLS